MVFNTKLSNNIRVVGEEVSNLRSVSIGIYIKNGSVDETIFNSGISHFIEHMFFKGTKKRTAKQLADDMSRIGGRINAYTSKEYVCFYAHVLDEHLDVVIDILSDMLTSSNLFKEDIDKEKGIILEEFSMYEDSPEEVVLDELHTLVWPDHSLGYNIIGTKENINNMTRNSIVDYIDQHYVGENFVISIVGKIDFDEVSKKIEDAFSDIQKGREVKRDDKIIYVPGKKAFKKEIEQGHMAITFPTADYFSDDTYALNIASVLLGGGLNSRLFQNIREEKGLAYSIYSYLETFYSTGLFSTYAATNANQVEETYSAIKDEIVKFKEEGITDLELLEVKEQIKSNLIIGMENMSTRMSYYGKGELLLGRIRSQDDMLNLINNVSIKKLHELIHDTFDFDQVSITLASPNNEVIENL